MKDVHFLYKKDTGRSHKTNEIETFIVHDQPCVYVSDLPQEYVDGECLLIPYPEYVEWLEEKVEELQKTN